MVLRVVAMIFHRLPDIVERLMFMPSVGYCVLLAVLALVEGLVPAPVVNWVTQELPLLLGGNW